MIDFYFCLGDISKFSTNIDQIVKETSHLYTPTVNNVPTIKVFNSLSLSFSQNNFNFNFISLRFLNIGIKKSNFSQLNLAISIVDYTQFGVKLSDIWFLPFHIADIFSVSSSFWQPLEVFLVRKKKVS